MQKNLLAGLFAAMLLGAGCSSNQPAGNQAQSAPAVPPLLPNSPLRRDFQPVGEPKKTEFVYQPLNKIPLSHEEVQQFVEGNYLYEVFSNRAASDEPGEYSFHGVVGPQHDRIEWYFRDVQQDSLRPREYRVTGLSRYYGNNDNIIPFEGAITLDSMYRIEDQAVDSVMLAGHGFGSLYTAKGNFELRESTDIEGAGVFWGTVEIDLGLRNDYFDDRGAAKPWFLLYRRDNSATGPFLTGACKGAGFLMKGYWTEHYAKSSQEILIARHWPAIANDILPGFLDNPGRYRNQGWDHSALSGTGEWWAAAQLP